MVWECGHGSWSWVNRINGHYKHTCPSTIPLRVVITMIAATQKNIGITKTCLLSHTRSHNYLCNMFVEFCHSAHLRVRVESSCDLTPDLSHSWPVDVLVLNWERWEHAAFDMTVTTPLIPSILTATSLSEEAAAEEAETRKHN